MIEFFQITGSASFAARCALEAAGAEYRTVDIHPRRRDEPASFAVVNPLKRVPALREGHVCVYETGAVLLYLLDRFPDHGLGPAAGDPLRAPLYRWILWLADTLHPAWSPLIRSSHGDADASVRERMDAHGAYLEGELAVGPWCLGDTFSVADLYLYMLVGWQSYAPDGYELGGEHVRRHYRRVGESPAVVRTRALDDLDERLLRYHPGLRAGQPI